MNHREYVHGLQISYWRDMPDGVRVAADKTEAINARISPLGKHWPEFSFDLPDDKADMEKLLTLASMCEAHGDFEARKQIRDVLGVIEPRR